MITRHFAAAAVLAAAAGLTAAGPVRADTELKALSSMATNLIYTQAYRQLFIDPANKAVDGIRINYVGGPEVTPASKAAEAIKRNVVDVLYGPAAYYAGLVPEALAVAGASVNALEARRNGGIDALNAIWAKRNDARILAWGISETRYNLYLTAPPKITSDMVTFEGVKIRSSPLYKHLLEAVHATPIAIAAPEFYTAMERGLVQGSGWPSVGLAGTGVAKFMKYRLDPPFYRANHMIIMNLNKWKALTAQQRAALQKVALDYEKQSIDFVGRTARAEEDTLKKGGMKIIALSGKAREYYETRGNDNLWKIVEKRSPSAAMLRRLLNP